MEKKWNEYSDSRFQALTSLKKNEFELLLAEFQPIVEKYFCYHTLSGSKRKRPMFKEYRNSSLYGSSQKLFFILYYLKNNSLQESIGSFFDICQGKVSMWTKQLLPLLNQALNKLNLVPEQDSSKLYTQLKGINDDLILYQDATVRPIEHSLDKAVEQEFYDGKHKCHTIKNHIVCNQKGQVLYVSPLYEGKKHDRSLIADENLRFPENVILIQDTGFQGFEHEGILFMPKKKPRKKELSELDKAINQIISSIRTLVEHVIGSIKILRIVKEKIRLKGYQKRQIVFVLAAAIHNLRKKERSLINHS